jgi:hypothetical protein
MWPCLLTPSSIGVTGSDIVVASAKLRYLLAGARALQPPGSQHGHRPRGRAAGRVPSRIRGVVTRFARANAAWLILGVLSHNLAWW